MKRKTILSIAFVSLGAAWAAWEITASLNPRDDLEPLTHLIADWIPPAITFAAIAVLTSFLSPHFIEAYAKRRSKTMDTTTIPATPEPGAEKEPLVSRALVIAVGSAAIDLAVAFGVPLTDGQRLAILGLIAPGAVLVAALWARKKVFAPATTRAMVITAARTGQVPTEPVTVPAEPTTDTPPL